MIEEVSEGIFSIIAESDGMRDGWGSNQGFILSEEGVVVIDTGFTRYHAERLLGEIKRHSDLPIRLVINTHDHSDHVFGNSIFAAMNTPILCHVASKAKLRRYGEERMRLYRLDAEMKGALDGLRIEPASITYRNDFSLEIGERIIQILHPNDGAHTDGDTMINLPEEEVLFAGDVLWVKYHPNLEDASVEGWLAELKRISTLKLTRIVPGHGRPAGRESIPELSKYLTEFDSQFRAMVSEDIAKDSIASRIRVEGTEGWRLAMIIARNVDLLYEMYSAKTRA